MLAAFMLSGAGPYNARLSPEDLRHIRTVAIVSALGNSFLFQHVGTGRFECLGPPDSHFLEISDWALDPLITRETETALGKRFAIKQVAFERAAFTSWNDWLLHKAALELNSDPAIDAYVLILRDWRTDEIGHSVHALGGLGLYREDRVGRPTKYGAFASYRVVVVDALTGDTIASRAALMPDGALPWLPASPSIWPKTQNDLSDVQQAALTADETKLIDETLLRTLRQMNLAP